MERSFIIDMKLQRLSCPFTWEMENVIKNRYNLLEANDDRFDMVVDIQEHFPEFVLTWHLMLAYENVMSDKLEDAMRSIDKAEQSLADMKKKETLQNGKNVLEHIFMATKCHIFKKLEKFTEIDEMLKNIYKLDDTKLDETEAAMLNGCRCLAWSLYCTPQTLESINFAKKAIECESTNGKWYYLLGKHYRNYRRRQQSLSQKPSRDETAAFEQAYKLSKNVLFGVSLARLYRESMNYKEATKIYKDIYDLEPTCCTVRLQLALGFIRAREFELAKRCLDYVAARLPNSDMYAHYMGIYEEKCNKDLKTALSYYQIAVDKLNYGAEWQYLECKKRIEPNWDPLPHLLKVLTKYEKDPDHVIQEINVQIGTCYLFEKHDILSACLCLTKAIKIQPSARILRSHRLIFGQSVQVNIYHVLANEIELELRGASVNHDDDVIEILKSTLELCRTNMNALPSPSEQSLPCSSRSQSLNRSENYSSRGLPSRRGNNREGSRPLSTSQAPAENHRSRGGSNPRNPSERNPYWRNKIRSESAESSSQSGANGNSQQNRPGRNETRFQKRENHGLLPKRSSSQETGSSPNDRYRPPNFRNQNNSSAENRLPVGNFRRNQSSNSRDNFESLEASAGCMLVKMVKLKL